MTQVTFEELLDAGCHFGHLKRKWNPNMAPYIFMERNGIHIIDLYKTQAKMDEAANALCQLAKSGKRVLFVATKKQAKDVVAELAQKVNMPYVTERWPGGMLTNFATIRKAVKKMTSIDKMMTSDAYKSLSKREKLQIEREREKLEKNLGSIADLSRLPSALFVATKKQAKDVVAELAQKVNMPYVTERWPGGMLTNFATIRKAVKKMTGIDKMMNSEAYKSLSKREKLQIEREREKLEKNLGSIADLSRLPSALFVVDIMKEHIAVAEARKLNIPTFAIVDTNTNPNLIDFPIPANDDASKSIALIVGKMVDAIEEGITERKNNKDLIQEEEEEEVDEMKENNEEEESKEERRPRSNRRPRRPVSKN